MNKRTFDVVPVFTYDAAMVSIESGREGGQYAETFLVTDAATLMTATKGPGVSGMPFRV